MRKIVIIFLPIGLNIMFWCSKEPSHRDGSFEYQQHMFWLRNKNYKFSLVHRIGENVCLNIVHCKGRVKIVEI